MKRLFFLLISLICASVGAFSQNPYESSQPSEWSGTGWMLNKGYVVTNHHVANNARTIQLKFMQGDSVMQYTAETVLMDEEHDLAILKINDPSYKGFGALPYAVKTSQADVGEGVFVLGYPLITTMGDEIKLTTGIISSHSGYEGNRSQYQISAPVQPGNSGGPLFDDSGYVVGIVNAKHQGAENVGYAVKAQHLQELVNRLPDKAGVLPTNNTISTLNLPQKVKKVKGLVCFIYCSTRGQTPRSAQPKHGAPDVPQGDKVIVSPYVDNARTENARITRITLTNKETIVEMSFNNELSNGGYAEWMQIAQGTTIETDDREYTMKRAEGIAIAPNKTTFTRRGETKTFRLIFPAIPKSTTSINLVEPGDNGWRFYGVSLKEY